MTWAGLYVSSLVLSAFGAWAISRYADRIGLVDCPNGRSSHCMPTPKGGGIASSFRPGCVWLFKWVILFWVESIQMNLRNGGIH